MNTAEGLIGCIAHCTVCEWQDIFYRTARKNAYEHARRTGHKVIGEQTVMFEYGSTEKTK